jgi:RNA ligase (TIGR02306 family)
MRKLASIQKVLDVVPIEGADRICSYKIQGWNVVDSVGKYAVGDLVIYCEIDSFIPTEIAPFLSKGNEPREYEGIKGERLRTVRLRGTLSQGLILPLSAIPETWDDVCSVDDLYSGEDVSELLGIIKYEPPVPACLAGEVKGWFPSFLRKTDQERIQNLVDEFESFKEYDFEISEKLDGSSCTIYYNDGDFGVCSRNLDLKPNDNNTFWKMCQKYDLESKLKLLGKNIAIQGEVIGTSIQGNPYKISGQDFYVFDIYDIDKQEYYNSVERLHLCDSLELKHVPVIRVCFLTGDSIESLLEYAEGKSELNSITEREGLVFKCIQNANLSFKAISNKFLLKEK